MPISHVQSRAAYGSGGNVSLAFSGNAAAGSLIVVSAHLYDGREASAGVTDSRGNTYTKLYWQIGGDLSLVLAMWYAINTTAGALTVTVNPGNAGGRYCSIGILEYSGIVSTNPTDGGDLNTGSGTAVSAGPVTTTNANDLLVAAMTSLAGSLVTIAPDGDYTQRLEYENGATEMHLHIQDRIVSATLTDTANWTMGSSQAWIGGMVAFKGDAGSGGAALVIADSRHGHTADAPAVAAKHTLVIADSRHAHAADSPTVTANTDLVVADSRHAHTADSPPVSARHALAPADSRHSHSADALALAVRHVLTISDSRHLHTADSPAPGAGAVLTIADARHGHTADALAIAARHLLAIADSRHLHSVDAPAPGTPAILVVHDARHLHSVDALAILQHYRLTIHDSYHGHQADSPGALPPAEAPHRWRGKLVPV